MASKAWSARFPKLRVVAGRAPERGGRRVEATEAVEAGRDLGWALPACLALRPDALMSRCHRCLGELRQGAGRRCGRCRVARYCSRACQVEAFRAGAHKEECARLVAAGPERARRVMRSPTLAMVARLVLRRRAAAASDEGDEECPLGAVDALVTHADEQPEERRVVFGQMAALVQSFVGGQLDVAGIARLLAAAHCNAMSVCDGEMRDLAQGVYPWLSAVNHSCRPNAVLRFEGRRAVLRAVRPVAAGEEVTVCYIDVARPARERRARLREQYFFECACAWCEEDAPALDALACCGDGGGRAGMRADPPERCAACGRHPGRAADEARARLGEADAALAVGRAGDAATAYARELHPLAARTMRARLEWASQLAAAGRYGEAANAAELAMPAVRFAHTDASPVYAVEQARLARMRWLEAETRPGAAAEARKAAREAARAARVTHGESDPVRAQAESLLREIEAFHAQQQHLSNR